ncbi:hypothetical protein NM688_g2904 [Phlebia brevispora]|uniref:Uncharacterized protein n=1 Tax=Phlebia brevispora TaxID=194682 RepID=A0ACC1T7N1_9APHY|nr:hypothetical protein NM688_g2904 [Phlebia brevispora]
MLSTRLLSFSMDGLTPAEVTEVIAFLNQNWATNAATLILVVVIYYDCILTTRQEVEYVWLQKFSGVTVIYFVNRYFLQILALLLLLATFSSESYKYGLGYANGRESNRINRRCQAESITLEVLQASIRFAQAVFMSLRIYAIWNRNVILAGIIFLLYAVTNTFTIFWTAHEQTIVFGSSLPGCFDVADNVFHACTLRDANSNSNTNDQKLQPVQYLLPVASSCYLLIRWCYASHGLRRLVYAEMHYQPISAFHSQLYCSEMVLRILRMSLPTLYCSQYQQHETTISAPHSSSCCLQSINISRFVTNLRHVYMSDGSNRALGSLRMSSVRFANSIVGNIGAPLHVSEDHDPEMHLSTRRSRSIRSIRSNNPLAVGLQQSEEQTALLSERSLDNVEKQNPESALSSESDAEGSSDRSATRYKDGLPDTTEGFHGDAESELAALMHTTEEKNRQLLALRFSTAEPLHLSFFPTPSSLSYMATLTRQQDPFSDDLCDTHYELSLNIPKPFPSRAEREQEELLEALEEEELDLEMPAPVVATPSSQSESGASIDLNHISRGLVAVKHRHEDVIPSIGHVSISCLTTLNDLLSTRCAEWTPIVPDRRHSLPPLSLATLSSLASSSISQSTSALQKLVRNLRQQEVASTSPDVATLSEIALLKELQGRVQSVSAGLPFRDAELARTLVSLLLHLHRASSLHPLPAAPTQVRVASWSELTNPSTSTSSAIDPFATLRRQVSDFQLERSSSQSTFPPSSDPALSASESESAALWSKVDEELGTVLSLCRSHPEPELLPPEYDPGDYEGHVDSLPKYEPASDAQSEIDSPYKGGAVLDQTFTRVSDRSLTRSGVSEKMKMDLDAVTMAIDRLYMVAPQLHNQRVELKKSKLEQMEKARQKGKQKETDADVEARELNKIVDLVAKAADRKMVDQAVVLDASFQEKLRKARMEDDKKRAAFVEQLARHSDAGRLHSQEAVFLSPTSRTQLPSQLSSKTMDPCAMLSLPEFIREGVPEEILRDMELRRDSETLLTLPEFIKRYPQPELVRPTPSNGQTISHARLNSTDPGIHGPRPAMRPGKNRSRSMSEPLAWLIPGSRSSSPVGNGASGRKYRSSKLSRPKSSNGIIPTVHEGLDVSYVAEYHENLQHVLAFFSVSGLPEGAEVEAEVVPASTSTMDEREVLTLRCGPSTSPPLSLPASVPHGKVDVTVVGGEHYQIKLRSNPFTEPYTPTGSSSDSETQNEFLDATHFQTLAPTSFVCSSCSLPIAHPAELAYRDLPSEHWAELVDAWMCHSDLKLNQQVKKGAKEGFWPSEGQVLVGGSYVLLREDAMMLAHLREAEVPVKLAWEILPMVACPGAGNFVVRYDEALVGFAVGGPRLEVFGAATEFTPLADTKRPRSTFFMLNNPRIAEVHAARATCVETFPLSTIGLTFDVFAALYLDVVSTIPRKKVALCTGSRSMPSDLPIRIPLSAFVVEDMNEYVRAHATYRFVVVDEEEERPRILVWLFKPNMRLAYTTPSQYVIPKSGSIRAAKVLFKILGPTTAAELPNILKKYPGFPQAEHLYYPRDVCRRLGAVLKESNTAYPGSMRTMTGLDVGWLQRV